jgi:hypothetical protein
MANSSQGFKKVLTVPKNHELLIHIPDDIPVNASVEVRVSIFDKNHKNEVEIIDAPIDSFLEGEDDDSIDDWMVLANDTFNC